MKYAIVSALLALSFVVGRATAPSEEYTIKGVRTNVPIMVSEGTRGSITHSYLSSDDEPPYICLGKCDQ